MLSFLWGDRVGALTKEWGFDDSKPPSEAPGYRAKWKHPTCCFCTNHTLSEEGSVMHSVLDSQPHENAVLIQLDEHYSVRSSPPRNREQKSPRGLVGTPILHPVGSMLKSKSLRVLNIGNLRGHMQTSCGRKRTFSSQRQTGCLWLTLVLFHSKADCILPPHRKEHYNSFATEFDSYDSLPSPERAISFQEASTSCVSYCHTASTLVQ